MTLTILGIVAAIVVPGLAKFNSERANKTKIKKALSSFSQLINSVKIENGFTSLAEIDKWANDDGQCSNIVSRFKIVERKADNACQFRTTDGLWWNVSTLSKTVVSFDENKLYYYNGISLFHEKTFAFTVEIDENGSLRIYDLGYDVAKHGEYYMSPNAKIKKYLDGEKINNYEELLNKFSKEECSDECNSSDNYANCKGCYYMVDNGTFSSKIIKDENGASVGAYMCNNETGKCSLMNKAETIDYNEKYTSTYTCVRQTSDGTCRVYNVTFNSKDNTEKEFALIGCNSNFENCSSCQQNMAGCESIGWSGCLHNICSTPPER